MARFISISLVVVVISNTLVFAQKHEPVAMRMLVQETAAAPSAYSEFPKTDAADQTAAVTMAAVTMHVYNNTNSNYLMIEVLGASKAMSFQLINAQGEEMYSGAIRGTQLIETESWAAGTYYFLCGTKRETLYISK